MYASVGHAVIHNNDMQIPVATSWWLALLSHIRDDSVRVNVYSADTREVTLW